jgi:predicted MPP superfamily phosphohydrolase
MESTLAVTPAEQKELLTRRNFLRLSAGAAAGLALYAGEISRHEIQIIQRSIRLQGLADAFAGMRIVQISDFHFEEYTEAFFLKEIVRKVNGLSPDVVVLTGDFVSKGPIGRHFAIRASYQCAELLREIQCPVRYAILGNHDAAVSAPAVTDALTTHGIPVLANSSVPLERDGRRLWLSGIEDAIEQRPNLAAALPAGRRDEPVILLAHEPDFADYALGRKIGLVLSGHTHGGQICVPFLPPLLLPALGKRYIHGLFSFADGLQLNVNRGIGAVLLPFRFRCPPEITVITLVQG